MNELQRLLLPLRRKLFLQLWCQWLTRFAVIGAMVCIVYAVASKWRYFFDSTLFFCAVVVVVFLLSFIIALRKCPSWEQTAKEADKLGYDERFVTAMELLQKKQTLTTIEQMVIEDASEKAKGDSIQKKYIFVFPKRQLKLFVAALAILASTNFVYTTKQLQAERYSMAQLKKIEEIKKETKNTEELDKAVSQAFEKEINAVTKQLKKAQTLQESQKAVEQAQQAIKELEKNSVANDLKKTAEGFSKSEKTKELASALEEGNSSAIKSNMDTLLSELKEMSQEDMESLADILNNIENLEDKQMQALLEDLSEQILAGNFSQVSSQGQLLQQKLTALASENEKLRENLNHLNQALAEANSQNDISIAEGEGQSGTQQQGIGQGSGQGEGGGEKGENAAGQGEGEKPGQGRGQGHKESENIFTRKAQEMTGYETQLQGEQLQQGESVIISQKTMGERGESIPYEQVYDSYRNQALKDIENSSVPYGMRELVSEYFSTLER